MDFADFKALAEQEVDRLGARSRNALRYMLDHPDDVAVLSMRKLAARARVSPATMVKLAGEFGFASYNDLKALFQDEVIGTSDYFTGGALELQRTGGVDRLLNLVFKVAQTDLENIHTSLTEDGARRIADAAERVAAAKTVYIVGLRSCYSVAHYLAYSLRLARDGVVLLDDGAGDIGDDLSGIGDTDVLIAIGFHPYVRLTAAVTDHAAQSGAHVLAITDTESSPLIVEGGTALIFSTKSPWIFGSITSAIVLSQALVAGIVSQGGKAVLERIAKIEKDLNRFSTFVN